MMHTPEAIAAALALAASDTPVEEYMRHLDTPAINGALTVPCDAAGCPLVKPGGHPHRGAHLDTRPGQPSNATLTGPDEHGMTTLTVNEPFFPPWTAGYAFGLSIEGEDS